jgi:hypothetical protein
MDDKKKETKKLCLMYKNDTRKEKKDREKKKTQIHWLCTTSTTRAYTYIIIDRVCLHNRLLSTF